MQTIRRNSTGSDVSTWQVVLGLTPDGSFGPVTEEATKKWQREHGLVDDGIVGPKTWAAAGALTPFSPPAETQPDTPYSFLGAKNFTKGRRYPVRLLVVHTMENNEIDTSAKSCAYWFANQPKRGTLVNAKIIPDPNGKPWGGSSAHYCVDRGTIWQSVLETDTAWHAGAVNDYAIGIEHAGRAAQTAAGWQDEYSQGLLKRSAKLAADLCRRYRIPVERLSNDQLEVGKAGFCGHVDVTNTFGPAHGHTDPGTAFPWDQYLGLVKAALDGTELVAPAEAPPTDWVMVTVDGVAWLVAPTQIGPIGIGEALARAEAEGCELPSPKLVDAIWKQADRKVDAGKLTRTFTNYTATEMNAPDVLESQVKSVAELVGSGFTLAAGMYKDVVRSADGRIGLYGWHRENGTPIQPFYSGHALAWRDYSQGLRLVRRAP